MSTPSRDLEKMQRILNALVRLAPTKTFGGMTAVEYRAVVQACLDVRDRIADLEAQITQALAQRDALDEEALRKGQMIVSGVRADPSEGPNSALYEEMGYTRESERKSGLTRKAGGGSTPPPK